MHDYTEEDRWDWDYDDPTQRCRHGNFIGSSWGPDILCGACESMGDDPSLRDMVRDIRRKIEKIQGEYDGMMMFVNTYIRNSKGEISDPSFSESVIETMKLLSDRKSHLESEQTRLIEKYEPFCEDGDWDDTFVLHNYHRHLIDQYRSRKVNANS